MKVRGVNLGGWLVLEKWMTPSVFAGTSAADETAWCVELGERAAPRLRQHWDTFITRADFAWLAQVGIDTVRIPVGHWIFGGGYPYHRCYGTLRHPYVAGGVEVLDRAFGWADELGLRVIVDLHAAPGGQNGFDNGGLKDVCEWHTQPEYLEYSLQVLERLAHRYGTHPRLHGIEVLNEPRWDVPTDYLQRFYQLAYERIRRHCAAAQVAVIFHDGFRSFREYVEFLRPPTFENVVLDVHRYQCFVPEDIDLDIYGHFIKSAGEWKAEADTMIAELPAPVYVGEWSLGLDLKFQALWAQGSFNHASPAMDAFQESLAYRGYAAAQLATFEKYLGWFFWSYKTETMPHWSFRDAVERGWLPPRFR